MLIEAPWHSGAWVRPHHECLALLLRPTRVVHAQVWQDRGAGTGRHPATAARYTFPQTTWPQPHAPTPQARHLQAIRAGVAAAWQRPLQQQMVLPRCHANSRACCCNRRMLPTVARPRSLPTPSRRVHWCGTHLSTASVAATLLLQLLTSMRSEVPAVWYLLCGEPCQLPTVGRVSCAPCLGERTFLYPPKLPSSSGHGARDGVAPLPLSLKYMLDLTCLVCTLVPFQVSEADPFSLADTFRTSKFREHRDSSVKTDGSSGSNGTACTQFMHIDEWFVYCALVSAPGFVSNEISIRGNKSRDVVTSHPRLTVQNGKRRNSIVVAFRGI